MHAQVRSPSFATYARPASGTARPASARLEKENWEIRMVRFVFNNFIQFHTKVIRLRSAVDQIGLRPTYPNFPQITIIQSDSTIRCCFIHRIFSTSTHIQVHAQVKPPSFAITARPDSGTPRGAPAMLPHILRQIGHYNILFRIQHS